MMNTSQTSTPQRKGSSPSTRSGILPVPFIVPLRPGISWKRKHTPSWEENRNGTRPAKSPKKRSPLYASVFGSLKTGTAVEGTVTMATRWPNRRDRPQRGVSFGVSERKGIRNTSIDLIQISKVNFLSSYASGCPN